MQPLSYERGVLDGFEIALQLFNRQFGSAPPTVESARRATYTFRMDASLVVTALREHKMGSVAAYFGYRDVWDRERLDRLRSLTAVPVDVREGGSDAGVEP